MIRFGAGGHARGATVSIRNRIMYRVGQTIDQSRLIADYGTSGEAHHVASGKAISMRNLLQTMLDEAGLDRSIVRKNVKDIGGRRQDVPVIFAYATKVRDFSSGEALESARRGRGLPIRDGSVLRGTTSSAGT